MKIIKIQYNLHLNVCNYAEFLIHCLLLRLLCGPHMYIQNNDVCFMFNNMELSKNVKKYKFLIHQAFRYGLLKC